MNERDGFLDAIAAAPQDDVPRLVFADWLDDHDDPLGEFIRLQLELEPLRVPRADPRAELERVKLLHNIPPGGDHAEDTPLARKFAREEELLREHRADWLGSLAALEGENTAELGHEFRRGFVDSLQIGLSGFLDHGALIRRCCPMLQRLIVFDPLGRCGLFAEQPSLAGLPGLTLTGLLTPEDADLLADSPHLARLRSLTVWVTGEMEDQVGRALARLPALSELVLVQLEGGHEYGYDEELNRRADSLAGIVNEIRGQSIARVERPFDRFFPIDGVHIGYGIDGGHLPGSEQVLLVEGRRPVMIHFDQDGRMVREEQLDLSDKLVKPAKYSWEDCDEEELIEVLGREIGFTPGPIFVREFHSELTSVGVLCWDHDPETQGEDECASTYWWYSTGQFALPYGNHYWADGLGRIHTS